jgi:ribosome-associated toxin RatA of RatAB toxin-antitoxin module
VSRWVVRRAIAAPIDTVFATVADIGRFPRAIPHIVKVGFLDTGSSAAWSRKRSKGTWMLEKAFCEREPVP